MANSIKSKTSSQKQHQVKKSKEKKNINQLYIIENSFTNYMRKTYKINTRNVPMNNISAHVIEAQMPYFRSWARDRGRKVCKSMPYLV